MADGRTTAGPRDGQRVNELRYGSETWGVAAGHRKVAVEKVGPMAWDVARQHGKV